MCWKRARCTVALVCSLILGMAVPVAHTAPASSNSLHPGSSTLAAKGHATGSQAIEIAEAPTVSAEQLDRYLEAKGSPLAGHGQALMDNGRQWNVDPRLLVAIAGAESSFGTRICAAHNAWNWFYQDTSNCSANPFTSWDQGIERVARGLRRVYLDGGRTTIPAIAEMYTGTQRDAWVSNVTHFYQVELGGDPNDLGFPGASPPPGPEPGQPSLCQIPITFPPLLLPFPAGKGEIINGYQSGTYHQESNQYSLDLCRDAGCNEDDIVLAPTDIRHVLSGDYNGISGDQDDYHIFLITEQDDSGECLCLGLGHFYIADTELLDGRVIERGQAVGRLAQCENGPHYHIGIWHMEKSADGTCNCAGAPSERSAVEFKGYYCLDGRAYEDIPGRINDHHGQEVVSTQGQKDVPVPEPPLATWHSEAWTSWPIGPYTLAVQGQGPIRVSVDGNWILDAPGSGSDTHRAQKTLLLRRGCHPVTVEYRQGSTAPRLGLALGLGTPDVAAGLPPCERETPDTPTSTPDAPVRGFFQAMQRLDVDAAIEFIAPVPWLRWAAQLLLELYRALLDALSLDNDFSQLSYQVVTQDALSATVYVSGPVTYRRRQDGSTPGRPGYIDWLFPVSNFLVRWHISGLPSDRLRAASSP